MKKKKIIPFINAENEYPENIIKLIPGMRHREMNF